MFDFSAVPHWAIAAGVAAIVLFVIFLRMTRPGRDVDGARVYSRLQRGWRRLAFFGGDLRWISHFPWVTWDSQDCDVSHEDWLNALKISAAGDVLMVTHKGFFMSNTAIPGLFKHAAFFSVSPRCWDQKDEHGQRFCDVTVCRIIEAISEGVVEHHPAHARGDLMIVVRPKGANRDDVKMSVAMARKIVGCDYDTGFKFNIEDELHRLNKHRTSLIGKLSEMAKVDQDINELKTVSTNVVADFDMAFSCTETVAAAWWHKRHELRLYRQFKRGRNIIVADQFVNRGFEVVWTNVRAAEARRRGLHEEGVGMIEDYWKARDAGTAGNKV
jgi:hypothetical protein